MDILANKKKIGDDRMFDKLQQIGIEIYNKGLTEGKKGAYSLENMEQQSEFSYQCGLNDAWKCAKKIYGMNRDTRMIALVFNEYETVFDNYSASEAIEKIKEYEEKKKVEDEIKVGDEVYFSDPHYKSVVTKVYYDELSGEYVAVQITENGKYSYDRVSDLHKTGRHFSQIAEVLEQMKE